MKGHRALESLGFSPASHFLIEGRHSLEAALELAWPLHGIYHSCEPPDHWPDSLSHAVTKEQLSEWLGFKFHRGVLAIAERPELALPAQLPKRLLGLNGIADPGNLGTLIRSALAFGIDAVLLDEACSDPFNAKAVRASASAVFKMPLYRCARFQDCPALEQPPWVATLLDSDSQTLHDWRPETESGFFLLLGNEGKGLDPDLAARADVKLRIPMNPALESLNVASAAAVILHQLSPF